MAHAFNLELRTTGRANKPLTGEIVRELTMEDVVSLQKERGIKAKPIKQLRQRHHALAKLLSEGTPETEAGLVCGYTASHVSVLKADSSFKDLLQFYADRKDAEYLELTKKIVMLGEDAVDVISARLEDNEQDFTVGQLLEVSKMSLDRSGHGPQTTANVNVNIGLAEKLAMGRQRALEARASVLRTSAPMVDITPEALYE